jgi:hypothetical protein
MLQLFVVPFVFLFLRINFIIYILSVCIEPEFEFIVRLIKDVARLAFVEASSSIHDRVR